MSDHTEIIGTRVQTSDGLSLSVTEYRSRQGYAGGSDEDGKPGAAVVPVVVAVHGYPDNQTVWTPVAELLADRYRVVTYDVRGHGASDVPAGREGYLIPQLVDDLQRVLDAVSPEQPVHLLAHDWGSIQAWAGVLGQIPAERIASYTSISGPSLDLAARWLRGITGHGVTGALKRARQLAESYYIFVFQAPGLPELAWRSGVLDRLLATTSRLGRPVGAQVHEVARTDKDRINGLELYRANILGRLARPEPGRTSVPVHVIAPLQDAFVTAALATESPVGHVEDLTITKVPGGHWIVSDQPALIAGLVASTVEARRPE